MWSLSEWNPGAMPGPKLWAQKGPSFCGALVSGARGLLGHGLGSRNGPCRTSPEAADFHSWEPVQYQACAAFSPERLGPRGP